MPRRNAWDVAWVLACIAASSLYCLAAASQLSATFDEPLYVARGLERWRTGSTAGFMRIGTMPLPADVQTLPLFLWERWRGAPFDAAADLSQLLPPARAATLCFWWVLLAYGFLAGRSIAGRWGGRLAVLLLAAEPTLLAHASLATTDVAVAACSLAFAYHFHAGRDRRWIRRVGVPALWFAAAVLAKASGLAIGIVTMAAIEIERMFAHRLGADPRSPLPQYLRERVRVRGPWSGWGWRGRPPRPTAAGPPAEAPTGTEACRSHLGASWLRDEFQVRVRVRVRRGPWSGWGWRGRPPRPTAVPSPPPSPARTAGEGVGGTALRAFAADAAQIVVGGLVLVFLYCGSDWRTQPSFVAWAHELPDAPGAQPAVWLAEHLRIFPNAGEALARQIKHNVRGAGGHWAYLLGNVQRAFWYYFPVALAIKLPLAVLVLPLLVCAVRPRALCNWATAAAAGLLLMSLTVRVQIGVRMVLPFVALAVVGLAAAVVRSHQLATPGWRRRGAAAAGVAAATGTIWAAAAAWPNGICYANELWGGAARTHRYLSDSNCDWGQGLVDLARWQREQGVTDLDVWYFGTDPLVRRLPLRPLALHAEPLRESADVELRLRGHRLAASTTLLYGTRMNPAHEAAAAFLRTQPPVGRTSTFFIYDFTDDAAGGSLTPGLSRK